MKIKNIFNITNNQIVVVSENSKIFWSYESQIAEYKNGVLTLGNDWDYSRTTAKYLHYFIENYTNLNFKSKKEIEKAIKEKIIKINKNFKSIT